MRLARAMKRKMEKSANRGEIRAAKSYVSAQQNVRHASTKEIVTCEAVRMEAMTNIMVTMDVAVNRVLGFGREKLLRLRKKIHMQLECIKTGYVTVEEIEEILRQELGMDFRINPDSVNWDMIRRTQYEVVRVMSAVFVLALRDEFGLGTKRADRAYLELSAIWEAINKREINIADVRAERDRIGKRKPQKQAA